MRLICRGRSRAGAQAGIASALPGDSLDNLLKLTSNFAGRAGGGIVSARGIYQVNEQGPELLNVGGKSLLMMGNQSGNVTPSGALRGSNLDRDQMRPIHITYQVQGSINRRTQDQLATAAGRDVNRAMRRLE